MADDHRIENVKVIRECLGGFRFKFGKFAHSANLYQDEQGDLHLAERCGQASWAKNPPSDISFKEKISVTVLHEEPHRGIQIIVADGRTWESQRRGEKPPLQRTVANMKDFWSTDVGAKRYSFWDNNCHKGQESAREYLGIDVPGRAGRTEAEAPDLVPASNPSHSSRRIVTRGLPLGAPELGYKFLTADVLGPRTFIADPSAPVQVEPSYLPEWAFSTSSFGAEEPRGTFGPGAAFCDTDSHWHHDQQQGGPRGTRGSGTAPRDTDSSASGNLGHALGTAADVVGGVAAGTLLGATAGGVASAAAGSAPVIVAAGYSASAGFYVTATIVATNPAVAMVVVGGGAIGAVASLAYSGWSMWSEAREKTE